MISRKKIISKSEGSSSSLSSSVSSSSDNLYKDDLHMVNEDPYGADDEGDENTWLNFDQLVIDQLEEIRNKWSQIDDEIWAKIICFERNRRIAKAYARSQVISITGSERGFDGYRIGLNGFPNSKRIFETQIIKQQIRSGFKLKIDDLGNIHIKRVGRCAIFWGSLLNNQNFQADNGPIKSISLTTLELNKPRMIFDFKEFQNSIFKVLSQNGKPFDLDYSSSLQNQCIHCIQLVVNEESRLLRHPCWILLINIVALDLLWSKFKQDSSINCILFTNRRLKPKNPLYDPGEENYEDNIRDLYYCGYMAKLSNSQQNQQQILAFNAKSKLVEQKDTEISIKSRYTRPNPMRQLPTFNRIGLNQSKRLFFSSHQLSLCDRKLNRLANGGGQYDYNQYLGNGQICSHSCYSRSNENKCKYSKVNHGINKAYRSTYELDI